MVYWERFVDVELHGGTAAHTGISDYQLAIGEFCHAYGLILFCMYCSVCLIYSIGNELFSWLTCMPQNTVMQIEM